MMEEGAAGFLRKYGCVGGRVRDVRDKKAWVAELET